MKSYTVNVPDQTITPIIKILLTLSSAIILAGICYLVFISAFINPWLENNQRELCVLNFYSQKNASAAPEVYFLGTSQMKEGLDCYRVEADLKESGTSYTCYNLAVNADTPLRRLIEVHDMIASAPETVVIGTDIRSMYSEGEIDPSRLMLVSGRGYFDTTAMNLFDAKQREILNSDPFTRDISNRIYIVSWLNYMTLNKLTPNSFADYEYRNNFKNPFKDMRNLSREEKMNNLDQFDPVNDTLFSRYYNDSQNKRALQHMVQELHNNSVRVIIINMPLDPLSSKKISDATLDNYRSYVNALGVPYYDFLNRYPSSSFFDTSHMNVEGRTAFSHDMAQVLAREAGQ